MKIAILGKVNPDYPYVEWEEVLEGHIDVTNLDLINITSGNGILNQYVKKYATYKNIPIKVYAADYKTHGDEAKVIRNRALVNESDIIVGFLPFEASEESWIFRPGIGREKRAIVIECSFGRLINQIKYWAHLFSHESGLSVETYVSEKRSTKEPYFYVGEHGGDAAILIDDNPRIIRGELQNCFKEDIFEFIKANKDILLKYWNWDSTTGNLLSNLQTIDMIKKRKV